MQNTTNLNLKKPDQTDYVNIGDLNEDVLDEAVQKKYEKPIAGIPKVNLEESLQASLDKANTALQSVTKDSVGLGNVDNTSDLDKPISTATQIVLDELEDNVVAHKEDFETFKEATEDELAELISATNLSLVKSDKDSEGILQQLCTNVQMVRFMLLPF